MQVNNTGNNHTHLNHHVTSCNHDHSVSRRPEGGAGGPMKGTEADQRIELAAEQKEETFSWSAWLEEKLNSGKKFLGRIWGDSASEKGESPSISNVHNTHIGKEGTGTESLPTSQISSNQMAAGATAVTPNVSQENPYFLTPSESSEKKKTWNERIKIKLQASSNHLFRSFSGQSLFQSKKEESKQDLRRHSRYREEEVEIECILTDDSYLLDSYDDKGEYSKISAHK